jgi:hypothetical protein
LQLTRQVKKVGGAEKTLERILSFIGLTRRMPLLSPKNAKVDGQANLGLGLHEALQKFVETSNTLSIDFNYLVTHTPTSILGAATAKPHH